VCPFARLNVPKNFVTRNAQGGEGGECITPLGLVGAVMMKDGHNDLAGGKVKRKASGHPVGIVTSSGTGTATVVRKPHVVQKNQKQRRGEKRDSIKGGALPEDSPRPAPVRTASERFDIAMSQRTRKEKKKKVLHNLSLVT